MAATNPAALGDDAVQHSFYLIQHRQLVEKYSSPGTTGLLTENAISQDSAIDSDSSITADVNQSQPALTRHFMHQTHADYLYSVMSHPSLLMYKAVHENSPSLESARLDLLHDLVHSLHHHQQTETSTDQEQR